METKKTAPAATETNKLAVTGNKKIKAEVIDSVGKPISDKEIASAKAELVKRHQDSGTDEQLYGIFMEWGYTIKA